MHVGVSNSRSIHHGSSNLSTRLRISIFEGTKMKFILIVVEYYSTCILCVFHLLIFYIFFYVITRSM